MPLLRRDGATARTVTHPDLLETASVASVHHRRIERIARQPGNDRPRRVSSQFMTVPPKFLSVMARIFFSHFPSLGRADTLQLMEYDWATANDLPQRYAFRAKRS
jgi:hypothetical protein